MLQAPGSDDGRSLVDPRRLGASADLVREQGLTDAEVEEIVDLFSALRRWHQTSAAHSEASRRYMQLGENDMRAIRYVMSASRDGAIVTSTMIAEHLGITGPSVTKMLDRLERAGHIRRERHPRDRRSLSIVVTPETRAQATATVGADHARRYAVAASLSSEERRAATKFLSALADLPIVEHAPPEALAG
ncbi:MarR family winged helix-turn-helix transcriptional regulator [Agrococcus sp. HG114]|uniref:MarR family winged helix-turn-helix transcriptional regulator n=1 Tax=Agrococcus sp. HG114 TaxID=2969757 RepID=UPI00215B2A49|nr:MarR family transcriptional regulator [Agrococcus sp. HG114]MCR8670832.1 MarR family transcriptional regulator [Agrococcus sp. HG114]